MAALAVAAGCAGPAPTVSPVPSSTPLPSAIAQPTAAASAGATQSADVGWTAVQPTGLPRVATLVPTLLAGDAVARTTAFLLTSLDGQSVLDQAGRVVAYPPVSFAISKSGDGAMLRPTAALAAATRYQFSLMRADGTVAASWSAQTAGPLHVADTVPGDTATGVPVDTGIEVTFDQAGVTTADMAAHFSISPATAGRFEASGRSVAFVPAKPLSRATLYTVTVRHGLPLGGTGETLAEDAIIRFETFGSGTATGVRVWLADDLVDASPRERAALSLWIEAPEGATAPKTVPVTVHSIAGLTAAVAAWKAIAAAPDWTLLAGREAVATGSLPRVVSASVSVNRLDHVTRWIQLPKALPTGWYVVTVRFAGVPRQLVLQVTETATYAMVTTTRTAIWVNDLRTRAPAVGATATLAGVALAGSADAQGLLVAPTPSQVVAETAATQLLLVRYQGNSTFRPASGACASCGGKGGPDSTEANRWWTLLTTDRTKYRQTDTINVLGVVKSRATGAAPAEVSLALYSNGSDGTGTPIQTQTATPDARGMYTAQFTVADLPTSGYWVRVKAGGDPVGETWFDVATIRKPAYSVAVTTNKHAVIRGRQLGVNVSTAFFEGTPVAGVTVALSANGEGKAEATASTDTAGQATGTVHPMMSNSLFEVVSVNAAPTMPEEASLAASTQVAVFAGSAYVSLDGAVAGSKVTVSGGVNSVAFGRYEGALADLGAVDPRGAPRAGATVRVVVTAHYLKLHQVGTAYDFVTKRVQPKYEADDKDLTLPARIVRTGADGAFRFVIPTTHDAYAYSITASYRDEAGRQVLADTWTESPGQMVSPVDPPRLTSIDGHGNDQAYAVGETVRVRFTAPATTATPQRYLYLTLQQGLRAATVGSGSTFTMPFTSTSVPDVAIGAVRFNGTGYDVVPWLYTARLDPGSRTMTVSATPDKARYQPGETATVSLRTLDPAGRPVAASVFVRAIDEKLYAMGAASDTDLVQMLYTDVPSGLIAMAWSHKVPAIQGGGGGGDTTGGPGGGRSDFRDWLMAKVVHTDADGRATVQIPLSDDLTSWRVAATAVDARLDAGATSVKLPVGLPFFVDAVLAPEYLSSDRPVLRVRSFGSELKPGTRVTFAVSSDTLPMPGTTVAVDAFGSAYVPLPALSVGTHRVRIAGSAVVDGKPVSDAMVRTFTVVASRATQLRTTWSPLVGATQVKSGAGLTSVVLVDAGRGRVVPILEQLASGSAVRSDQELAAALANRVLRTQFGLPAVAEPDPNGLDTYMVQDGLSIVSWGSVQLDVTALAAMAGDPRIPAPTISSLLTQVATSADETRARRLLALAGLAALGEPVAGQIRAAAAQPDLTVEERAYAALGALEAGDEALAGALEQQVLAQAGLRRGDQVRVEPGPGADMTVITARLAIVAASLGDPVAAAMDAYVEAHPSHTTLVELERALAARGWATRVAGAAASAALTVDGSRRELSLKAGQAIAEVLTPAQARSATVEPVSGSVLVVQTWDGVLTPSSLTPPKGFTVERTVSPFGTVPADGTVVVTYAVTISDAERGTCWRLVDSVPSGLAPIPWYGAMSEPSALPGDVSPTLVDGQRVEFCVGWAPDRSQYTLRYVARVVTPGTYTWEPAVIQSTVDPSSGTTVAPTAITISAPGS